VPILPCVNLESWLICLVSDSISDSGTKHHLGAPHEVVHYVLQTWLEGLLVNHVEVNLLICRNLDSNVSFDKVNLPAHFFKFVVLRPFVRLLIDFEKENGTRRSCDQSLIE